MIRSPEHRSLDPRSVSGTDVKYWEQVAQLDLDSREHAETINNDAERLRLLLNAAHIVPWEIEVATDSFTYVGDQAEGLLGFPIADWYENGFWSRHLHPDDRERVIKARSEYCHSRDNYDLEYRMITSDGRVLWLHSLVNVICEQWEPKTLRGFFIDITEIKQKEAKLRELSRRLINTQEDERRRIARELHDDLNQRMALLSIELEQLGQGIQNSPALHVQLEHLQTQAREISSDIHRLSYKLHPSKLDHLGLAPALNSLCNELSATGNLAVELHHRGLPVHPSPDVTLCLYRIAQEALHNSVKHSGARLVTVLLEETDCEIRLTISDDGAGFDLKSDALARGLGFTSMHERLRIMDGTMEVQSEPRRGTTIRASVPLRTRDSDRSYESKNVPASAGL